MAFAYGMGCLHNKSGFVGLPPVNHYGWPLIYIGHKYSPINGPVWQLAILWRHGRTRRHLRHLFPIDGPANSGEPPSWKLMARTPLLFRISDQQSCKFRGAKSSYIFQKSAQCWPICNLADVQPDGNKLKRHDQWRFPWHGQQNDWCCMHKDITAGR